MHYFDRQSTFYNQPVKLTQEEKENPTKVIADFFSDFDLAEVRTNLAAWLECALITNNPQFADPAQRACIYVFSEKLEELVEAAYILVGKRKAKELSKE
jgi:hypothetical protein